VDVAARHSQRGVVLADGLLVRAVKQAVHLAPSVVVELDLAHAELIGPGVTRVLGDLRDGLGGQLQILVKVHESRHDMLLRPVYLTDSVSAGSGAAGPAPPGGGTAG
jgi:hypothetical protein